MKMNKLLILALPLLLAISACNTTGGSSNQSSQDNPSSESSSSSEPDRPSFSEEELPEKTPEELKAEAEDVFETVSDVLANGEYFINYDRDESYFRSCVGKGLFITEHVFLSENNEVTSVQAGYMSNKEGVLRLRNPNANAHSNFYWSGNIQVVGFALKTNSLEESRAAVEAISPRFIFNAEDWTYVSNLMGVSTFKTTNADVLDMYASYEYNGLYRDQITAVYARLNNDCYSMALTAEGSDGTIELKQLNDIRLRPEHDKAIRGDSERYSSEIGELIRTYEQKDMSDTEWLWISTRMFSLANGKLPFPTDGNKYWFMDDEVVTERWEDVRDTHFGFFDTGDISTSYLAQLGEGADMHRFPGETNKFYFNNDGKYVQVTTRFVSAEDTVNPTHYPKGIFYIDLTLLEGAPE